ncbi:MAG: hypothetical protein ACTSW1_05935 [Candidatus Hodarchaeales archaeon]
MSNQLQSHSENSSIFSLLGEAARILDRVLSDYGEERKNYTIIMKKMPQFFEWVERSKTNPYYLERFYLFLKQRQTYYLPIKRINRAKSTLEQVKHSKSQISKHEVKKYQNIIQDYYSINKNLGAIKKLIDQGVTIERNRPSHLEFMQGYDGSVAVRDEFIRSWTENTFIEQNPVLMLGFTLGRYYYRVVEREISFAKNFGLTKQIIPLSRRVDISNLLNIFERVNTTYFHTLRFFDKDAYQKGLGDREIEQSTDPLKRYRNIIEDLFEKFEERGNKEKVKGDLLRFCFASGFLVRNKADNVKKGEYKKLALEHDVETRFSYDLGKLMSSLTYYEIKKLKSHSYKNLIGSIRVMERPELVKTLNYLMGVLVRSSVKNAMKKSKETSESEKEAETEGQVITEPDPSFSLSYKNKNLAQRTLLYFIKNYSKLILLDVDIAHIAFMMGYNSIRKTIDKKQDNKNKKGE